MHQNRGEYFDHDILLQRLEDSVRSGGYGSWMDPLVPDRSNTAGLIPWMPVVDAVRTVRHAARVGAWPTAVHAIHHRVIIIIITRLMTHVKSFTK